MPRERHDRMLPRVRPNVDATAQVPGSKSLANRAILQSALAEGRSDLSNIPAARDVHAMIACLAALGVQIQHDPASRRLTIQGCGGRWPLESVALDAGDAGTVLRFMTAAVCIGEGEYWIDGSEQLRARPMAGLVEALRALGARIKFDRSDGHCPLMIEACGLRGGQVSFDSSDSSQYVSALLQAAPLARGDVFIEATGALRSRPFVSMTLQTMDAFGAAVVAEGPRWIVPAPQRYTGTAIAIEPDATNASYFFGLAALSGGSITIAGLHRESTQGDMHMLRLLESMGCTIKDTPEGICVRGPADGRLHALDVDLGDWPDLSPTVAVLAMFADAPSRIRGVPHLRLKESDRLCTISHGLERLGARSEIHEDGLTIFPAASPTAAAIDAHEDHRIAMAFAMASARLDGIVIQGAECAAKSFPDFFDEWQRVT